MAETTNTQTKQAAPKVEKKPAAKVAPKAKPAAKAAPKATPKAEAKKSVATASSSDSLYDIAEVQMDATEATIVAALTKLDSDITSAREIGSDKAKTIVSGFGGETKMAELIEKLAGYMGEAAATGMMVGMSPMIIMAGTAKGVYKKITD